MRILEIIPQLCSGGGERFTVDLCNAMVEMGHEVYLMVLFPIDKTLGFYYSELSPQVKIVAMNKQPGFEPKLLNRVRKKIREINPAVIHTHLRAINYIFPLALFNNGRQYVHTIHNTADKEASDIFSRNIRKYLFRSKKVQPVTISDESNLSFQDFYGLNAPIIFNGRNIPANYRPSKEVVQEIEEFKSSPDDRVLVNLARLMPVKRQPLIARVCKRLEDEGYNFTMLMIGRKGDSVVVSKVNEAGSQRVRMLGERSNPLDYLAAADGFCLMSEYEGMPISLIEAMGVGAVPVCTPVGGIADVVKDGRNGVLSDDISEESCYRALKRFLDLSNDEREEMSRQAKESYLPFSMDDCARRYIELFKSKQSSKC